MAEHTLVQQILNDLKNRLDREVAEALDQARKKIDTLILYVPQFEHRLCPIVQENVCVVDVLALVG